MSLDGLGHALLLWAVKLAAVPYGFLFRERRPGLVILIYHRIGGGTSSSIDLPAALFARQMDHLRVHHLLVGMDAVVDGLPATDRDALAVTFDDGYQELYDQAMPVLTRLRIPATIYVATDYVERQRPLDFGGYARLRRQPRPLTWAQLRQMAATGLVTVGAHTHQHVALPELPPAAARAELERSRRLIEDRVGTPVRHFAYPWGAVTPVTRALVAEFFATAVRGGCGKNPYGMIDPLALWRQPVQQADGFWLFPLRLASYLDAEEPFRQWWTRRRRSVVPGSPHSRSQQEQGTS